MSSSGNPELPPLNDYTNPYNPANYVDTSTATDDPALSAIYLKKAGGTCTGLINFSSGLTSSSPLLADVGAVSTPSYSFIDHTNSGLWYRENGDFLAPTGPSIVSSGSTCLNLSSDGSANFNIRNDDDYASIGQLNNSSDTAVFQSAGTTEIMCDANGFGDHTINFTHIDTAVSDPIRGGGALLAQINEDGQFLASDGTKTLPSVSFMNDVDTGMYSPTANELAFSCGDDTKLTLQADKLTTKALYELGDATNTLGDIHMENGYRLKWASGGTESCQVLNYGNDFRTLNSAVMSGTGATASRPAFSFIDDEDSGMYLSGTNQLGFAVNGEKQLEITPTALIPRIAGGPIRMNIGDTTNTFGIVTIENNYEFQWASGGVISARLRSYAGSILSTEYGFVTQDGTESAPAFSFVNNAGAGLYRIAEDNIGFSIASNKIIDISDTDVGFTQPVGVENGTATDPTYTFTNDKNTGIFSKENLDTINFTAGGIETFRITNTEAEASPRKVEVIIQPNPYAVYNFLDSADRGADSSGNGFDGTATGSPPYLSIYEGRTGVLQFVNPTTALDDYIDLSSEIANFSALTEFSASLWVRAPDVTSTQFIISFSDTGEASTDYAISLQSGSFQLSYLDDNAGGTEYTITSAPIYVVDTWYFVSVSTGSNGAFLWVNGVQAGTNASTSSIAAMSDVNSLLIGGNEDSGGKQLPVKDMYMSQIVLFDRQLTFDDHISQYNAPTFNYSDRVEISQTALTSHLPIYATDGTTLLPSYSFTSDTNTGMYSDGANSLGFSANGVKQLDITNSNATFTNQVNANWFNPSSVGTWGSGTATLVNLTGTAVYTSSYYQRYGSVHHSWMSLTGLSLSSVVAGTTTSIVFDIGAFSIGSTLIGGTAYINQNGYSLLLGDITNSSGNLSISGKIPTSTDLTAAAIDNIRIDIKFVIS